MANTKSKAPSQAFCKLASNIVDVFTAGLPSVWASSAPQMLRNLLVMKAAEAADDGGSWNE